MWEQRNGEKGRNSFKLLPHGGSFKVFYHIALFGRKPFHERTIDLKRKSSRDAKTLSPPSPPPSPPPPPYFPPPPPPPFCPRTPSPSPPPSQNGTPTATATGSLLRISDWTKSQTFKTLLGQSFFLLLVSFKKKFLLLPTTFCESSFLHPLLFFETECFQ